MSETRKITIPFNGSAYDTGSDYVSSQICENFCLKKYPGVSGDSLILEGGPGLRVEERYGASGDSFRGMTVVNPYSLITESRDLVCAVLDDLVFFGFYSSGFDKISIFQQVSIATTTTGPVSIASNGTDLVVVDGVDGFVIDMSAATPWTSTRITDPDFPGGADTIVCIDGYYLANRNTTQEVWRSDFNDGTSWGGLAFSTAGYDPDWISALSVLNKDVYVIGTRTTEVWYNTGEEIFNFTSIPSAFMEIGIVNSHAHTTCNNALYWVGLTEHGSGDVYECINRVPRVVSTPAITKRIRSWGRYDDITVSSYSLDGQSAVVIASETGNESLVYDSTIGEWHVRTSMYAGVKKKWRGQFFASVVSRLDNSGFIVCGCDDSTQLWYTLRSDYYYEQGGTFAGIVYPDEDIVSIRRTPVIRDNQNRITVHAIEIWMETGVGNSDATNPTLDLRWSRDFGKTWSNWVTLDIGADGEHETRVRHTQLGQGRNWVFEVRIAARIQKTIIGASLEVTSDG